MKKQLTALLATTLLLTSLTGCTNENSSTSDDSSVADTSSSVASDSSSSSSESENSTESTSSDESSFKSETTSEAPTEVVRVQYKDAEIPDIHLENCDSEGRVSFRDHNARVDGAVDGIIFETHTMGDYTITLIGDGVRTDTANFPDKIFVNNLYAEVTKNSVIIDGGILGCYDIAFVATDVKPEDFLLKDKIGSYIDGYELERSVIATRYFYPDDGRVIENSINFYEIYNDTLSGDYINKYAPGTGITGEESGNLMPNTEDGYSCRYGTFTAEEFTIIDNKTLEDTAAGVRYNFNFTDPPEAMLYSTTLI